MNYFEMWIFFSPDLIDIYIKFLFWTNRRQPLKGNEWEFKNGIRRILIHLNAWLAMFDCTIPKSDEKNSLNPFFLAGCWSAVRGCKTSSLKCRYKLIHSIVFVFEKNSIYKSTEDQKTMFVQNGKI